MAYSQGVMNRHLRVSIVEPEANRRGCFSHSEREQHSDQMTTIQVGGQGIPNSKGRCGAKGRIVRRKLAGDSRLFVALWNRCMVLMDVPT